MINKNTGVGDIYIFVAILFQWNTWNEISSYKTIFIRFPMYLTSTLKQFIFFLGGGGGVWHRVIFSLFKPDFIQTITQTPG